VHARPETISESIQKREQKRDCPLNVECPLGQEIRGATRKTRIHPRIFIRRDQGGASTQVNHKGEGKSSQGSTRGRVLTARRSSTLRKTKTREFPLASASQIGAVTCAEMPKGGRRKGNKACPRPRRTKEEGKTSMQKRTPGDLFGCADVPRRPVQNRRQRPACAVRGPRIGN